MLLGKLKRCPIYFHSTSTSDRSRRAILLWLAAARLNSPASPPIADPNDHRLKACGGLDLALANRQPSITVRPVVFLTTDLTTRSNCSNSSGAGAIHRPLCNEAKGVKTLRDPVSLWLSTDTEIFKRDEYEDLVTRNGFAAVASSPRSRAPLHDRPMKQCSSANCRRARHLGARCANGAELSVAARRSRHEPRRNVHQGSGASIAILASAVDRA